MIMTIPKIGITTNRKQANFIKVKVRKREGKFRNHYVQFNILQKVKRIGFIRIN